MIVNQMRNQLSISLNIIQFEVHQRVIRLQFFLLFSVKSEVIKELDRLHEEFVLVPADKIGYNIVFVCKAY